MGVQPFVTIMPMAKVFFGLIIFFLAWVLWVTVPRAIMRECPVCQGKGYLELEHPLYTAQGNQWVEQTTMLCPFCNGGKISLYDLREHQTQMLRWMVKEQKLNPEVLVQRVKESFGQSGLDELHQSNFFMDSKASQNP